ncbi:hypothetical protein IWQ57_002916, partial [Coemansia nantahalensis]
EQLLATAGGAAHRTRHTSYLLICAPLETIHRGPLVDRIWAICKRDNIQVSFAGPDLNEAIAGRWSGAFVVNRTLQVLPIDTMHLTDRNHTAVELGACPLVRHLQGEVLKTLHSITPQFM